MPERVRAPRGTQDLLPPISRRWQHIEAVMRDVAAAFCYEEVRTPIFEDTALIHRGVGETTDVVGKETYTFTTRGGDSVTLRPEGTAPVIRALLQANLLEREGATAKVYYLATPMFRYERPQAGRLRQHHQFGCEAFGVAAPEQDVELMLLQAEVYRRLNLEGLRLEINSLGDGESKQKYASALRDFFTSKKEELSEESQRRLETNPLRIIDSKDPRDVAARAGAPSVAESLSEASSEHFRKVRALLEAAGQPFVVNDALVRGLDYYTDTLWEFVDDRLGAQATVGGGGRFNNLVESLGGKHVPAVGFGMGMERLLLALEAADALPAAAATPPVWVVAQGEAARDVAFSIVQELRRNAVPADMDLSGRGMKAQFKLADRHDADRAIVIGDQELENNVVILKSMKTGEQQEVPPDALIDVLMKSGIKS
jgi:histidyl-tRNA synthetase